MAVEVSEAPVVRPNGARRFAYPRANRQEGPFHASALALEFAAIAT